MLSNLHLFIAFYLLVNYFSSFQQKPFAYIQCIILIKKTLIGLSVRVLFVVFFKIISSHFFLQEGEIRKKTNKIINRN